MSAYKNTPVSAATLTGAGNQRLVTAFETQEDNITNGSTRQPGEIEKLLRRGESNAIKVAELGRLAGGLNNRALRRQIEQERLDGALILSTVRNGGGYFLPSEGEAGQREIAAYINTLTARAVNTFRTLRVARRALRIINGQTEIAEVKQNE
jgi:hypothetical protein